MEREAPFPMEPCARFSFPGAGTKVDVSFMPVVIIVWRLFHELSLRLDEDAVCRRVTGVVRRRHVGNDQIDQVARGRVFDLMILAGRREDGAAGLYGVPLLAIAITSAAFEHVVQLPLGGM